MSPSPWKKDWQSGIKCCKDCVPPKRHVRCHSKCEEYNKEWEENEKRKEYERTHRPVVLKSYDFDEINFSYSKRYKKKGRRD